MLTNSSSSCNDSILHEHLSFLNSYILCMVSRPSSVMLCTYYIANILLHLPLSVFILYHGLQQWQKKHTSSATISHSDSFTYHLVIMELTGVLGCFLTFCGLYSENREVILIAGNLFISVTWFGEMFFHMLTCVERYLAIVHPITYISLRSDTWIRIRNICIGCVWLLCFAGIGLIMCDLFAFLNFWLLVLSITVVSFCSISAQRVLIRPTPGEQGRERVDQSKQRAFYTILLILGVLFLRFAWGLCWVVLYMTEERNCVLMSIDVWFNLPSTMVLQLLFLYRAGKLLCCKRDLQNCCI